MVEFFIPHLRTDPLAAEAEWERCAGDSGAPASSRRIYSMTYGHEGSEFVVKVGDRRLEYRRRTGPRGGRLKDAGYERRGRSTGTEVSAIIDAGPIIYVWSYGPPFGGWANPSLVGKSSLREVEYFS